MGLIRHAMTWETAHAVNSRWMRRVHIRYDAGIAMVDDILLLPGQQASATTGSQMRCSFYTEDSIRRVRYITIRRYFGEVYGLRSDGTVEAIAD